MKNDNAFFIKGQTLYLEVELLPVIPAKVGFQNEVAERRPLFAINEGDAWMRHLRSLQQAHGTLGDFGIRRSDDLQRFGIRPIEGFGENDVTALAEQRFDFRQRLSGMERWEK